MHSTKVWAVFPGNFECAIVIPISAQTGTFASEVTLFNAGSGLLTASVKFYEANNSSAPGLKMCLPKQGRSLDEQL